ncbi:MAG TPA: hypothetical protein EYO33_25285 [Phycisphaerales bacterium]|nr:hypothetical protein [Phycisphaerales bacterium]
MMGVTMVTLLFSSQHATAQDYPKAKSYPRASSKNSSRPGGVTTKLERWSYLGKELELSYASKGRKYQLTARGKHGVNFILMICSSRDLSRMKSKLKECVDTANGLEVGQSKRMGRINLAGGYIEFSSQRSVDNGPWVALMFSDTDGIDEVNFGVFDSRSYSGLLKLLDARYSR